MATKSKSKKPTVLTASKGIDNGVSVSEKSGRKFKNVSESKKYFSPEKGGEQTIEGSFIQMNEKILSVKSQFGEAETRDGKKVKVEYSASLADEETGEITYLPSTKVLNDFFRGDEEKKQKPVKAGEFVRITYEGKKLKKNETDINKSGATYHSYKLERELV